MSLQFRHSFKVFPGFRINVSRSGLSASVGAQGATLNFGKTGIRSTIGIPGSGLSVSNYTPYSTPEPPPVPNHPGDASRPAISRPQAIASAAIENLTSASLVDVQRTLMQARDQATQIQRKLQDAIAAKGNAERELDRRSRSIFRFFYKARIRGLLENLPALDEEVAELMDWKRSSTVELSFQASDEAKRVYGDVVRKFSALRNVSKVWDITAEAQVDRVKARSIATRSLDRKPARLLMDKSAYIKTDTNTLVFENKNGEDIKILPGVAVLERADGALALVDLRDVIVEFDVVNFVEDEVVPSDAHVIRKTWAKVNKDGSPDKRFNDNYEIPVCQYGQLVLTSQTGIREEYQFSNALPAREFAEAFASYKKALSNSDDRMSPDISKLAIKPTKASQVDGTSQIHFDFEFHCAACGSYVISVPDDRADHGGVSCSDCGAEFGSFSELKERATEIGKTWLADGSLTLSASTKH
ncbi:DUF4236 domain-containing protein [Rhizobium sp. TH2]|uniref:DUF4236 domain-containing protein n=1 Tax=Rhizobium sp. TH2 TaxID=2775403 RepID=UPI0021581F2F|nr:DUF4236 domain-containing protein [Rhizobium sp. TH2]UVC08964.1 DUF4236 domain-containing protein [Rhizobium sp. TH2]